jgi:hypothetical protein
MPDHPQEFVTWQFLANEDLEVTSWEESTMTDQAMPIASPNNAPKSVSYATLRDRLANLTTMRELVSCVFVLTDEIERINGMVENGMTKSTSSSNAPNNLPDQLHVITSMTSTLKDVSDAHIVDELLRRLHSGVLMPRDSQTQTVEQMEAMKHLQVRLHALYRTIGRELSE